jgi:hypothetical protein
MLRLALAILAVPLLFPAERETAKGKHEVFIEGPTILAPDSRAALRVAVFESFGLHKLSPAGEAEVEVTLQGRDGKPVKLFSGKTGADGTISKSFDVPDLADGDYAMSVKTKSAAGSNTISQSVKVRRGHRILLVTDKPLYQPGQTMHLRALALAEMTLKEAAENELLFEVEDAKGNKVFKKRARTNAFGVAAIDFTLADEVNMGAYRVTALLGGSKAEKTVTVKRYVLPKFKIKTKTERAYYLPLETVKGSLQTDYFFGKPVKDGRVTVVASTFDVRMREFARLKAKTDAKGFAEFEVKLPDYFVGQPLKKGNAFVQLEVSVVDPADHEEKVTKTLSVADSLLQLHVVPESGKVVPGIENILYVLTTAPDGSAVEADVKLKAGKSEAAGKTNASGFAALRITPEAKDLIGNNHGKPVLPVTVSAGDEKGNRSEKRIELGSEIGRDRMLLRLDKAVYEAGEVAVLDLFGTFDRGKIFIDVVRKGQAILTTTCDFEKGKAQYKLPLSPELFGSLEVHAYKIMGDGEIVRDTRIVYVQPPSDLTIHIETDKKTYLPAGEAKISFKVTDRAGKGVQSALGVIIVDESVYALQDMQPGLEKVYFTLQEELLKPRYQLKFNQSVSGLIRQPKLAAVQQEAAKILMAPAEPKARRWNTNTIAEKASEFNQKLVQIYYAFQNSIMNEKMTFWEEDKESGKRRFKAGFLDELVSKKKLNKKQLQDPWGNKVTLEELAKCDVAFTFDHWAKVMSAQNVQMMWAAFYNAAGIKDINEETFKELIKPKMRQDYFGVAYTLERLAKEYPVFSAENIAKMTDDRRKNHIFQHLRQAVNTSGGVLSEGEGWRFAEGFEEKQATGAFFRKLGGGTYKLEDLAKENACFAAANFAKIANIDRRAAIYNGIWKKIRKSGIDSIAVFEKEWKWKPGLLETLVKEGILTAEQLKDVAGRPVDFDAIVKSSLIRFPAWRRLPRFFPT